MKQDEKPKRHLKRSDNVIPDYDYLFTEQLTRSGKPKNNFFSKLIKLNIGGIILSSIVLILMYSPSLINPVLTANVVNTVTEALTSEIGLSSQALNFILINAVIMFVLIIINVPTTKWRWRITSKIVRTTGAGVKASVVRKLQSLSITYHKDIESGKVQSKFLKDTEAVDGLFSSLLNGFAPCILSLLGALIIALSTNYLVALFFLVIVPIDVFMAKYFNGKLRKGYRDYRVQTENLSAKMTNMLEMMPVTKSHGLEKVEISSFKKTITGLTQAGLKVDKNTASFGAWSWVVHSLMNAICLGFCVFLALQKVIGVGDIMLYQTLFTQISGSVSSLINYIPTVGSGLEALSSVSEIMNATDVEVTVGKAKVPCVLGSVKFDGVSYRYPDTEQNVVDGLDLDVKAGECIAFVGASGSGKSTVMNMIIGFLKPVQGNIYIDGKNINDINLSVYRHNISVVPQNSILFSGTIRENITYGLEHYTEQQLQSVVEMANLNEFIKDLPNGLDTIIGEHGDKLSGGQKQRITIARALIRNPKILILDEATSALDNISEYHVQKAISSSIKGRTTFIVAHRLSTIRDADRIVVMDNGVAVEIGTYDELMAKRGKFFELKALSDMNLKTAQVELGEISV